MDDTPARVTKFFDPDPWPPLSDETPSKLAKFFEAPDPVEQPAEYAVYMSRLTIQQRQRNGDH